MAVDQRTALYHQLHTGQLQQQVDATLSSAQTILQLVRQQIPFRSMVDIGCGLGAWLKAAKEMGIADVMGIEGPWLDPKQLVVDRAIVKIADMENPIPPDRNFDLAISIEVAEHLPESAAKVFIDTLTSHSPYILFSAAIPFQGGTHHVNEQFLDYWCKLFAAKEYYPVDSLRWQIWNNNEILWWLRQNLVLFVSDAAPIGRDRLNGFAQSPISVVHPAIYEARLRVAMRKGVEFDRLVNLLKQTGDFRVELTADGQLNIAKRNSTV